MTAEIPINPSGYDMPKPTRFLILDDLSLNNQEICRNLQRLSQMIDSTNKTILVDALTLSSRLKSKYEYRINQGQVSPVQLYFTIGNAGEKVFKMLDLKIPQIKIYPTRVTMENGQMQIVSKVSATLSEEIESKIKQIPKYLLHDLFQIGVVDDTIFSGETLKVVIQELKRFFPDQRFIALALTYLPHIAKGQISFEGLEVVAGLTLRSSESRQAGINSIDARDFIDKGALPLANGNSLSFMDEENWMRAWFGKNYEEAMNICRKL